VVKCNQYQTFRIVVVTIIIFITYFRASSAENASGILCSNLSGLPFINVSRTSDNFKIDSVGGLSYPENIIVPAEFNSCSRAISSGLKIQDPDGKILSLTWEMSGATTDYSSAFGVNQLESYVFQVGETMVVYRGMNKNGREINCSFTVLVTDNNAPRLIRSPGNLQVSNSKGECGAKVFWTSLEASDNCVPKDKITINGNYSSGEYFPIGTTIVSYEISDGRNVAHHNFRVTVTDDESPVIMAPEPFTTRCGEAVPDAFTTWEQFEQAGGNVTDNCEPDYSSFKYLGQISSRIFCPYTVTRFYEISDINGNISRTEHYINVVGSEVDREINTEQTKSEGVLKSGAANANVSIIPVNIVDVSCYGGNDGSIDLDTSSTNGGITAIQWSHGPTTLDVSGLSAGTYTVQVTDADGTVLQNFTIDQPGELTLSAVAVDVSCNGGNDGAADVMVSGGTPPYSYLWSNGATIKNPNALIAGSYNLTVTDANGCNASAAVTVDEPSVLTAGAVVSDVSCHGANDGSVTLSVNGGIPPYSYLWNNGSTDKDATGLSAGSFSVTITDSKGCTTDVSAIVNEPLVLSASATSVNVSCNGGSNGSVSLSVNGGTPPYSYLWNNGSTNKDLTSLVAGNYSVTISDSKGCQASATAMIREPSALSISTAVSDVSCYGGTDGSINLTVNGGTLPYAYLWNTGNSAEDLNGLAANTFAVTVTDGNGCVASTSAAVTEPDELNALVSSTNISCNGADDGSITVSSASGGLGNYEYRLNSGNWQTSGDFSGLPAASYSVQIRDADNPACLVNLGDVSLSEPEPITAPMLTGDATICYNSAPGEVSASPAGGGNNVFSYQWQQSTDGTSWSNAGESGLSYSPPVLTATTYYRLEATDAGSPSCGTVYSDTIEIKVVDDEKPTFTVPGVVTVYAVSDCSPPDISSSILGTPTGIQDNCSALAEITVEYNDDPTYYSTGSCNDYIIHRTWTVRDLMGNEATAIQKITVVDNQVPTLNVPEDATIECHEDSSPANTGQATATDNCDESASLVITYSDSEVAGNCYGRKVITRTWTATDCKGNSWSDDQTITVEDNTPPVINCPSDMNVATPDDIPLPSEIVVTATDNCGAPVRVEFVDEEYTGLEDGTGFCPKTVTKYYEATDSCGNKSTCSFVIYVDDVSDCYICQGDVQTHYVDLSDQPSGSVELTNIRRDEEGVCCDFKSKKNMRCTSFNIELDDAAVGVTILVDGALPNSKDYRINCFDIDPIDHVVCIPGDDIQKSEFYNFVYCKEGNNANDFTFISVPGAVATGDLTTRVDCSGEIEIEGVTESSVYFTDLSGNGYERFLDPPSGSLNPTFTPDSTAPAIVRYEVCGNIADEGSVCAGGTDCDVVEIVVLPKIEIDFNIDPQAVCKNDPPIIDVTIHPAPSGSYTYEYYWYNGYDAQGTPLNAVSTSSYQPSTTGPYSLKVIETKTGVICNEAIRNFDWEYDYTPYNVFAPGNDLTIECADYDPQDIIDWLKLAYVEDEFGNLLPDNVTNNFAGITQACGEVVPVVFSASDDCGNLGTDTAFIYVNDNANPVIDTEATVGTAECTGSNPNENPAYIAWLANHGNASASDLCDDNLTWSADTATATWSNDPANNEITVTFTVTDDCDNNEQTSATFTISDTQAPSIICPGNVSDTASFNFCAKTLGAVTDPTMDDNCSVPALTYTRVFPDGTSDSGNGTVTGLSFPVGVTTVSYLATDAAGLTADCSFQVRIVDVTPPGIGVGCGVSVEDTVSDNSCSKISAKIPEPTYFDNCWPNDSLTMDWSMTGATSGNGSGPVTGEYFNVGLTTVKYIVSDPDGNADSCFFDVRIHDITPPGINITGCEDVEEIADADSCSKVPVTLLPPDYFDNCWPNDSLELTYRINGATSESGTGSVVGKQFDIGVSTVTYTVTDPDGNKDSCWFDVRIIHNIIRPSNYTCPQAIVTATAEVGECGANLTLGQLTYVDPCNEIDSVWNNSLFRTSASDASGFYPVGTTHFNWYITDISGNIDSCEVAVTVEDLPPSISCPGDYLFDADLNRDFASGKTIALPTFSDNCPDSVLTWEMIRPDGTIVNSSAFGINFIPDNDTFLVDTTTITYTIADRNGNKESCSFLVIVRARPEIDCPSDTTINLDGTENNCEATFDPGVPYLVQGVPPIEWTYTVIFADGRPDLTGNYSSPAPGTATPLGDIDFPAGVNMISWRAENASGFDTCSHRVVVIDTIPPDFTTQPYENCVDPIQWAIYNPSNPNPVYGVNPNIEKSPSPDYRLFEIGDTSLDLLLLEDNCCDSVDMTVHWRIEFSATPDPLNPTGPYLTHPDIEGTGQPSTYIHPITGFANDINLWGDGVFFTEVVHRIYYWVEDCNGNMSETREEEIKITPRPEIIKNNY